MERFPAEILSQIICALSEESDLQLAPYATISHRFRAAVEQQTFAYLILNTHDLPQLREAFKDSNAYRRGFLSSILFRFVLPDEGPDPCCEAGRMIDREADSSSFTESVKTLFDIVQDASKSCLTAPPPLYLRFVDATRNTDPPYRNYGRCSRRREKHDEDDKVLSKAQRGFYDFAPLAAGKLPILDDVTEFDFGGGYDLEDAGRRWMGHVLGQLPALERLSIDVTDVIELGLGIRNSLGEGELFPAHLRNAGNKFLTGNRSFKVHRPPSFRPSQTAYSVRSFNPPDRRSSYSSQPNPQQHLTYAARHYCIPNEASPQRALYHNARLL
jgi:hypothetical protein